MELTEDQIKEFISQKEGLDRIDKLPLYYGDVTKDQQGIKPFDLCSLVETLGRIYGWNDGIKISALHKVLRGQAAEWAASMVDQDNWNDLKKKFVWHFEDSREPLYIDVRELEQRPDEDVFHYWLRLSDKFHKIRRNMPETVGDCAQLNLDPNDPTAAQRMKDHAMKETEAYFVTLIFIGGLREEFRDRVAAKRFTKLQDCLEEAQRLESLTEPLDRLSIGRSHQTRGRGRKAKGHLPRHPK